MRRRGVRSVWPAHLATFDPVEWDAPDHNLVVGYGAWILARVIWAADYGIVRDVITGPAVRSAAALAYPAG